MARTRGEQFREAFDGGYQACIEGDAVLDNPYRADWRLAREWNLGWTSCQESAAGAAPDAHLAAGPSARCPPSRTHAAPVDGTPPRMLVRLDVAASELATRIRFYETLQSVQALPVPQGLHRGGRMIAVGCFLLVERSVRSTRAVRPVATLLVDNIHAYYRRLIDSGSRIVLPLRETMGGGAFSAENPDGLVLEYLELGAHPGRPVRPR